MFFFLISGVLQGCPLSGTLFVLANDPLLYAFEKHLHIPGLGCVRACAGDIGICLDRLSVIEIICVLFDKYRLLSGLALKPQKCICIVLSKVAKKNPKLSALAVAVRLDPFPKVKKAIDDMVAQLLKAGFRLRLG